MVQLENHVRIKIFFVTRINLRQLFFQKTENYMYDRGGATMEFMMNAISHLGQYHLLDEDFKHENHLYCLWDTKDSLYRHWMAIFEQTDRPSVIELKEKLQNSAISYEDFCHSIVEVYFTLLMNCTYPNDSIKAKPRDIIKIFDHYKFDHTQRDSVRILFSLHRKYGVKF